MTRNGLLWLTFIGVGMFSYLFSLSNVWTQAPKKAEIAFVSDRDGNGEIYVMDVEGKNQRNLTNHQSDDQEPAWFDPTFSVAATGKHLLTWGWLKRLGR